MQMEMFTEAPPDFDAVLDFVGQFEEAMRYRTKGSNRG